MTYRALSDFIKSTMRMSHIYQPVMLMTLLRNQGTCKERELAKAILDHDESQIEYYTKITNNMVGRVLRSHEHVTRDRKTKTYQLVHYESLSPEHIEELISLCQERLEAFLIERGEQAFQHRRKSQGYVSGTLKYEVLKRARFRCELCGISADTKALEADHIIPKNKGGSDDLINLQALCYSCNAMKRDRDDTDFRAIRESYAHRETGCPFCEIEEGRRIDENELVYAIRDGYPVTELHTLVIPKRHAASYFDLGQAEINACNQMLLEVKKAIIAEDGTVTGFNVGINDGETAGQTISHCHIHLVPRRAGDVANHRGGIRAVIPGKQDYTA